MGFVWKFWRLAWVSDSFYGINVIGRTDDTGEHWRAVFGYGQLMWRDFTGV